MQRCYICNGTGSIPLKTHRGDASVRCPCQEETIRTIKDKLQGEDIANQVDALVTAGGVGR